MRLSAYITHIENCDRNRALMARILLNTLGHAKDYPVDIAELRFLSPENRAITNAFEEWAFCQPGMVMEGMRLPTIFGWARGVEVNSPF